jgi:hypothetical protein
MKHLIISFVASLFLVSVSFAQKASDQGCLGMDERIVALISQYKELRDKGRRLPDGTYDRDLRDYGGKIHRVMDALGLELGRPPFTRPIILECLGEPDAIKKGKQMSPYLDIYNRELRKYRALRKAGRKLEKKSNREYLIYYWRGGHDFIFFINEGGLIVDYG